MIGTVIALLLAGGLAAGDIPPVPPGTPGLAAAGAPSVSQATARPDHDPFTGVFRNLWTDLQHLPSRENAWVLLAGGAAGLLVHPADRAVTGDLSGSSRARDALGPGAAIGSGWVQAGGAVAAYAVGRLSHHPTLASAGSDVIRAQVLATILTTGLKIAVSRTRPDGASYSFPSGHTSAAFATAAVLERYGGWKWGVPAYAVGTYVGASRLAARKHFLSDVVFGAAVGIMSGRTVTVTRSHAQVTIAPAVTPGGVALMARVGFARD